MTESESKSKINRRGLLIRGMAAMGALGASALHSARAESCLRTVTQPEGPFYPIEPQSDTDFDLTRVKGKVNKARGEEVILKGIVRDGSCNPIQGALVEIWQACDTGKYNHASDPNPAVLDPNFQYWGTFTTNENGEYHFKTIIPGAYAATAEWTRPPHIHMKVQLRGFEELITQVYFEEFSRLNATDRILRRLSRSERDDVIIDYKSTNGEVRVGSFDITLNAL